jgi:hypothetical protein
MKTSEKSILRVLDLQEQPAESEFVLLPTGLDRVLVACDSYMAPDDSLTVYGPGEAPLCNISTFGVVIKRALVTTETLMDMMRRMHADQREAEQVHEELEAAAAKQDAKPPIDPHEMGKLLPFPSPPDRGHGTYL